MWEYNKKQLIYATFACIGAGVGSIIGAIYFDNVGMGLVFGSPIGLIIGGLVNCY